MRLIFRENEVLQSGCNKIVRKIPGEESNEIEPGTKYDMKNPKMAGHEDDVTKSNPCKEHSRHRECSLH
jgi:hypothetical protein